MVKLTQCLMDQLSKNMNTSEKYSKRYNVK